MRRSHRVSAGVAAAVLAGTWTAACGSPGDVVGPTGVRQEPLPPPRFDVPANLPGSTYQTAVLAGGCFWSVEAVFEHVKGVLDVVSGYTGGTEETATYEQVAFVGNTDHAEAVEITYDPTVITYGQILRIFFSAAHDPTQVDQQDPDFGRQYRSNIFYRNSFQREVAEAYIAQLDSTGLLPEPIATRVDSLTVFYWAEDEHQDYVVKNPTDSYVLLFSFPKIITLGGLFPNLYRERNR